MALSNLSKMSILILVTVTATVTVTVEAAKSGFADFLGIGPNDVPIINGTIINNDNKTYGILIVPTGNGTVPEIPPVNDTTPPVVIPPVVNDTVPPVINDTTPPVVNDTVPPEETVCGVNEVWNGSTCECKDGYTQDETESCVPEIPPVVNDTDPVPDPVGETKTVIFVGDVSGNVGVDVFNYIRNIDFDLVVVLGDLWYGNWEQFQKTYGSFGNKLACVLGNHEYDSAEIEKLSLTYCGNDWNIKEGYNGVLLIGENANEGLATQTTHIKAFFANASNTKDIHTVVLSTHQPCKNTKGSHHGVESDVKAFCDAFDAAVPNGINKIFISGHEHLFMKGQDGPDKYYISGGGGRSHYDCGTIPDPVFKWCDDSHYGILKMEIKPDGTTTEQFIDYKGVPVN